MTNILIWKVCIFISVFKLCNCSQLYFICNFGVASDFSSRTIFHGRHFSQLVEGWTFGGAVSLSMLFTLIHFHRFLSRDNFSLHNIGDVTTLVFCYHNCSNVLWEKIVLVWGKKLRKKFANSRLQGREIVMFSRFFFPCTRTIFSTVS